MPDPLTILREQLQLHVRAAERLRQQIEALSGEPKRGTPPRLSNGTTELTRDEWRQLCQEHGISCSINGEVDAQSFLVLNNAEDWQLKRWIADGVIKPIKRGGGRKNFFTVEHFNILRSRKEQNGLDD
jgi:hypothetical protein